MMNDDQTTTNRVESADVTPGAVVNDATGETIGTVASYARGDDHFVLRGGWLFPEGQDTPIPLAAIADRGASGLYLNLRKEEVLERYGGRAAPGTGPAGPAGWAAAPAASDTPVPGTAAPFKGRFF